MSLRYIFGSLESTFILYIWQSFLKVLCNILSYTVYVFDTSLYLCWQFKTTARRKGRQMLPSSKVCSMPESLRLKLHSMATTLALFKSIQSMLCPQFISLYMKNGSVLLVLSQHSNFSILQILLLTPSTMQVVTRMTAIFSTLLYIHMYNI